METVYNRHQYSNMATGHTMLLASAYPVIATTAICGEKKQEPENYIKFNGDIGKTESCNAIRKPYLEKAFQP